MKDHVLDVAQSGVSFSEMGSRWYIAPLDRISSTLFHCGWSWRSGFIVAVGQNSDP